MSGFTAEATFRSLPNTRENNNFPKFEIKDYRDKWIDPQKIININGQELLVIDKQDLSRSKFLVGKFRQALTAARRDRGRIEVDYTFGNESVRLLFGLAQEQQLLTALDGEAEDLRPNAVDEQSLDDMDKDAIVKPDTTTAKKSRFGHLFSSIFGGK